MCIYISSEVVLANLLAAREVRTKVSIRDILEYVDKINKTLKNVYVSLDNVELDLALQKYNDLFYYRVGNYYITETLPLHHFNSAFDEETAKILVELAQPKLKE